MASWRSESESQTTCTLPGVGEVSVSLSGDAVSPSGMERGQCTSAGSPDPSCDSSDSDTVPERSNPWPPLRLRVLQSSILHKDLSLAVLDAYAETQFGRDVAPPGSQTPKIQLKEMQVSKLHATAFWDQARREWAVVDMGSKHGTFLQSARHPDAEPIRLSPPRIASIPRPLRHLDRLTVGSTTFLCHIHEVRIPCAECTSTGQGIIALFAVPKESHRAAEKRPPDAAGMEHTLPEARDAKKALTSLKRTLLTRLDSHHEQPSTSAQPPASYVDRSARRRAMHPSSQFDSPGVRSSRSCSPGPVKSSRERSRMSSPAVIEERRTLRPLAEHNVGRRLLMKQGWQPGTCLGLTIDDNDASGLIEPIQVYQTPHRAGIGMPQKPVAAQLSSEEWKANSRERRWESMRASEEAGT